MQEQIIAHRYAVALSGVIGPERWDSVAYELHALEEFFNEMPHVRHFLIAPVVNNEIRYNVLNAIVSAAPLCDEVRNFYRVIFRKGRMILSADICTAYASLIQELRNRAHARIYSAFSLSEEDRYRIVEKVSQLAGKELVVIVNEDKTLLAGVRVHVGNTIYDFSLQNKLVNLERALQKKA